MHAYIHTIHAEVEDRLAVAIVQEEEVRVFADEHLEREACLTKLLEDLYRKQKVEGATKTNNLQNCLYRESCVIIVASHFHIIRTRFCRGKAV